MIDLPGQPSTKWDKNPGGVKFSQEEKLANLPMLEIAKVETS